MTNKLTVSLFHNVYKQFTFYTISDGLKDAKTEMTWCFGLYKN